jgi:hypothetical protein
MDSEGGESATLCDSRENLGDVDVDFGGLRNSSEARWESRANEGDRAQIPYTSYGLEAAYQSGWSRLLGSQGPGAAPGLRAHI